MKRVILVDMLNMFVRNFAALKLSNPDTGEFVGGTYGCLQSFWSTIRKFKPDAVFIIFEGKGSAERRRRVLKEYKDHGPFKGFNRGFFETTDEDERESFSKQLNRMKLYLEYLPFFQAGVDYLEADDVIAYLCRKVLKEEYEKIIVSTDRDYFQLLSNDTHIFRPVRTKMCPDGEFIKLDIFEEKNEGDEVIKKGNCISVIDYQGPNGVVNQVSCHPENYILVKCAVGDNSDNIDGLSRVGEKTLLKDFPFLFMLKDGNKKYEVDDLIEYAKNKVEKENVLRYEKYLKDENIELLKRNERLMQLLDPDISLASVQSIEGSLQSQRRLNPFKLRLMFEDDCISFIHANNWIDVFSSVTNYEF